MSFFLLSAAAEAAPEPNILDSTFGHMLNTIFNAVYSISPVFSLGLAIIIFTLIVKALLFPLALKQYVSTKKMQIVQPELKKLQDRYKDKKDTESQQKMAQEMNNLYKEHGTNPFGGCLTALIQIPIFLALFSVLRDANIYITKLSDIYNGIATKIMSFANYKEIFTPFIKTNQVQINNIDTISNFKKLLSSLTSSDWTTVSSKLPADVYNSIPALLESKNHIESFLTINLTNLPSYSNISVLIPILTALTTYITIKYSSATSSAGKSKNIDPNDTAAQMEKTMAMMNYFVPGLIFLTTFSFPCGLGIYWLLGNIISIAQQFYFVNFVKVTTKEGVRK